MRTLGLIPARGGSKGITGKNIRILGGKPVLAYSAEAALGASRLDAVILSTDSEEIAEVGRTLGIDVPFLRPAHLAADDTPMLPVVQHALDAMAESGHDFDAVCLLQPSSPFRTSALVDECIGRLDQSDADSVVTVLPIPAEHNPHWAYEMDSDGTMRIATGESTPITRRQDLPPAFHREGSVYVTRSAVVRSGSLYGTKLIGCPVDPASSVNLDDMDDWARAEAMVAAR